jgi:outer membrane immunogenic protein
MKFATFGRIAVTALLIAAPLGAASAADMPVKAPPKAAPPPPVVSWTGCYIGVEAGGNWGRTSSEALGTTKVPGHDLSGSLAGGTVGCNYQFGQVVVGVEGDDSWANKSGSANLAAPTFNPAFSTNEQEHWIATVRGRVGWAAPDGLLLYVTGGGAWASLNVQELDGAGVVRQSDTHTMNGATVGGGIEFALSQHLSAKAEFLYVQFQNKAFLGAPGTGTTLESRRLTDDILRAGVNWRF